MSLFSSVSFQPLVILFVAEPEIETQILHVVIVRNYCHGVGHNKNTLPVAVCVDIVPFVHQSLVNRSRFLFPDASCMRCISLILFCNIHKVGITIAINSIIAIVLI